MTAPAHVIVVGAGILGASIAWHMSKAGLRVTIVGKVPGGIATAASFAWINASWGNPEPYFRLRRRAMDEWDRLCASVPGLAYSSNTALCWDLPEPDLSRFAETHRSWGYALTRIDRAGITEREPHLALSPDTALLAGDERGIDPVPATLALLADARRAGATLLGDVTVERILETAGRASGVETDQGLLAADHVVVAAGAATPALLAPLGIDSPLETPPGLLVHSAPAPRLLNGLVISPDLHMRQTAEGRIVAGSSFGGADPGMDESAVAAALFARVQAALKGGEHLSLAFHTLGHRPTPADGFPVVGQAGPIAGLSLAVTHSGVTLAPAIGLFLAREIAGAAPEPLLSPYRPDRFQR